MAAPSKAVLQPTDKSGVGVIQFSGQWRLGKTAPAVDELFCVLGETPYTGLMFDCESLAGWDSSLLTCLARLISYCKDHGVSCDRNGLPEGVKKLLNLAEAVPEAEQTPGGESSGVLSTIGTETFALVDSFSQMIIFIGEAFLAFGRLITGRARFRWRELFYLMGECGAQALPIVSLIAFLVGVILAFVSAVQLKMFGATIYVANMVGLAMARDMGAMMAGIIMAGRTGAAFAAQIGTMQVNEEIDALRTLGISPMDFLVLPRLLALTLMMPLLCIYADFMGILGGAFATVTMSEVTLEQYFYQTQEGVPLIHFASGILKSGVYGILVAMAGCLRGIQCGRSAQAVGEAATAAVVSGIVWIVVSCAVITVVYFMIGF